MKTKLPLLLLVIAAAGCSEAPPQTGDAPNVSGARRADSPELKARAEALRNASKPRQIPGDALK